MTRVSPQISNLVPQEEKSAAQAVSLFEGLNSAYNRIYCRRGIEAVTAGHHVRWEARIECQSID